MKLIIIDRLIINYLPKTQRPPLTDTMKFCYKNVRKETLLIDNLHSASFDVIIYNKTIKTNKHFEFRG